MKKVKIIAFYLPQFYPTPENDKWWYPGFTEWTNVAKAKPLFRNHYQPKIPADLNFYDLRVPETREKQAILAKQFGIDGFCYWHYWFAGRRLLDKVFHDVVESDKPNFPFCLCWANHSWYAKTWDPSSKEEDKLLIEQTYPGISDYESHFNAMLPAFRDKRYMNIDGLLIFGLFAPLDIPDLDLFIDTWNRLAKQNNLKGFYFFGYTMYDENREKILSTNLNSCIIDYCLGYGKKRKRTLYVKILNKLLNRPLLLDYKKYSKVVCNSARTLKNDENLCIIPNFDHSPRSGKYGTIYKNATPDNWKCLLNNLFPLLAKRTEQSQLLFIKAWNEWGEGNYLEPDQKYGKGFLEALKEALTLNLKD